MCKFSFLYFFVHYFATIMKNENWKKKLRSQEKAPQGQTAQLLSVITEV